MNPAKPPARQGPMQTAPMIITAYNCAVCGLYHRKPSRGFKKHYEANARHYGWRKTKDGGAP